MKRLFTIAVLTISLLALLAACGKEATPTANPGPSLVGSPGPKTGCPRTVGYFLGVNSNAGWCRCPPRDFHRRYRGAVHRRADARDFVER